MVRPDGPARVWIVAPSYRDTESFVVLRDRVRAQLARVQLLAGATVHFVLVDDSAGLDDAATATVAAPDTTILTVPFNLGHQRALVYGLRRMAASIAESDVVVTIDADGEDQPEDLPRLINALLEQSPHLRRIVLARRTQRQESLPFKVLYRAFRVVFRLTTGLVIDSGNYAAYRGWLVQHLLPHPFFDLCYSSTLLALGMDLVFVPCARGRRYAGTSRMGLQRLIAHGFRMLMPFLDQIAVRALTAFSVLFATATLGALGIVVSRALGSDVVPEWYSSMLVLAGVASLMAMGNAVVLFAVYTHSHGLFLRGVEGLEASAAMQAPERRRTSS